MNPWWIALLRRVRSKPMWALFGLAAGLALVVWFGRSPAPAGEAAGSVPSFGVGFAVGVLLKLGIVIGLVFVTQYLVRELRQGGSTVGRRALRLEETLQLSPRQALHLVRAGDRRLVVGVTEQACTLLAELEPVVEEPASQADRPSFATVLRQWVGQAPRAIRVAPGAPQAAKMPLADTMHG
jgi:flagellar biosynthetic protein FliO